MLAVCARVLHRLWPLVLGVSACASHGVPCASPSGCPRGKECLASRCVPEGSTPVPSRSRRILLTPTGLALAGPEASDSLPPSVTLGQTAEGPRAFYLRFPGTFRGSRVRAAFLLLEPRPGAPAGPDVPLEVWRADRDWRPEEVTARAQPGFALPVATAIGRAAPPALVRVDVTEIVQFLAAHPDLDHGVVVRATSKNPAGIAFATGVAGGTAPRLDVYVD